MIDDKIPPIVNDRPEQPDPVPVGEKEQQSQASAAVPPGQRVAPGRRPLFRS